jgi:hypothetical protein
VPSVFSVAKKKNSVNQRESVSESFCAFLWPKESVKSVVVLKEGAGTDPTPKSQPGTPKKAMNIEADSIAELIRFYPV